MSPAPPVSWPTSQRVARSGSPRYRAPESRAKRTSSVRFFAPNRDDGYFFISPSTNLACGFLTDSGRQLTGCQAWVRVANLPDCDDPQGASSPAISFRKGQRATGYCLSEGVFSAETKILQYGHRIKVGGITCTSQRTGVTCLDDATGRGFSAARAGFTPIG